MIIDSKINDKNIKTSKLFIVANKLLKLYNSLEIKHFVQLIHISRDI